MKSPTGSEWWKPNKSACSLLLAAVLLAVFACGQPRHAELVRDFLHPNDSSRDDTFDELYFLGKEAIPPLIEAIADTSYLDPFALVDPIMSNLPPHDRSYAGIKSAYMVDQILAQAGHEEEEFRTRFFLFYTYLHGWGRIVRRGSSDMVSADELKEVRRAYEKWWNSRKHLSLVELRARWQMGDRPLNGSAFVWQ